MPRNSTRTVEVFLLVLITVACGTADGSVVTGKCDKVSGFSAELRSELDNWCNWRASASVTEGIRVYNPILKGTPADRKIENSLR